MPVNFDFLAFLTILVAILGAIWLIDSVLFAPKRVRAGITKNRPFLAEQAAIYFPILFVILLLRSFIVQPYRVPTGSLEPTVLPGDLLIVTMYNYGLRLPITHWKLLSVDSPKVGDIALFRWPVSPDITFVKRIIGVPGDRISYKNKQLVINGKIVEQHFFGKDLDHDENGQLWAVNKLEENLEGVKHNIFTIPDIPAKDMPEIFVPSGYYFVMGDNRDASNDSRSWGLVPEENLIGKAVMIWMNWDSQQNKIRWERIGIKLSH